MPPSTEERLASLEQGFRSVREGLERMEKAIEKLDSAVTTLIDKLDLRYPSQESVNLRFGELQKENEALRERLGILEKQQGRLQNWQYKVAGGIAVIAFGLGIAAKAIFK